MKTSEKNIVIFINAIRPATFAALREYREKTGIELKPIVFADERIYEKIHFRNAQSSIKDRFEVVVVDFDSPGSVRAALKPIESKIFAVTAQYENSIHELQKISPYLPYLTMPSESSLSWATEKKLMRELLHIFEPDLVPKFMDIQLNQSDAAEKIHNSMNYPIVIKPSGLEGSLLVSKVNNKNELAETLDQTSQKIQEGYDTWIKRQEPLIVAEEFMEGDMYSVDVYVGHAGEYYFTPLVKVITGYQAGYEDFFGYARLTPVTLQGDQQEAAISAARKACLALNLKSVTAHVELMHTKEGWKIIELGPRIGGYRHDIYEKSFGINHIVNDILIRASEVPNIPTKTLAHTAVFNIYAKAEGKLSTILGLDTVEALESFVGLKQIINIGEELHFARNNGDPVLEIVMVNPDPIKLNRDIKILEENLKILVD